MNKHSFLLRIVLGAGICVGMLTASDAWALNLEQAKAQGLLGETASGYLETVRADVGAEAQAVRDDINQRRKQEYQQIAQKNGSPLAAVEALAGKKAIEKTPAGRFVKANGQWVRK